MTLTAEQLALVEAFQKASDDKVVAIISDMFLVKYGEKICSVGDNVISFATDTSNDADDVTKDDPYDDNEYIISLIEALDAEGIDVAGEIEFPEGTKTTGGFTINCLTACVVRWQTCRKTPKINFWT